MNLTKTIPVILLCSLTLASCKEKKEDTIRIISHKEAPAKKAVETKKVGDYSQTVTTEWLGNTYSITVERKAKADLPVITQEDGSAKYYDNAISLKITRADGSVFFSRTFTKNDFNNYVDKDFMKKSALLGIVFNETKGNNLSFAGSVGNPDILCDEFVPFVIKISNLGKVTIEKDSNLDTCEDEGDDEGV